MLNILEQFHWVKPGVTELQVTTQCMYKVWGESIVYVENDILIKSTDITYFNHLTYLNLYDWTLKTIKLNPDSASREAVILREVVIQRT